MVKHCGPTYLTFLLGLFYVLCCFASVFVKPNPLARKSSSVCLAA